MAATDNNTQRTTRTLKNKRKKGKQILSAFVLRYNTIAQRQQQSYGHERAKALGGLASPPKSLFVSLNKKLRKLHILNP